jgi:hypothetical protein
MSTGTATPASEFIEQSDKMTEDLFIGKNSSLKGTPQKANHQPMIKSQSVNCKLDQSFSEVALKLFDKPRAKPIVFETKQTKLTDFYPSEIKKS